MECVCFYLYSGEFLLSCLHSELFSLPSTTHQQFRLVYKESKCICSLQLESGSSDIICVLKVRKHCGGKREYLLFSQQLFLKCLLTGIFERL